MAHRPNRSCLRPRLTGEKRMLAQLVPALRITLILTVLTGLIYPGSVTLLCQWLFPTQANGSLVVINGRIAGSRLIGQSFTQPEYFHSRPSAAGSEGYDASSSSGSNLGPTSRQLADRVKGTVERIRRENPAYTGPLPADLATASASGLDPHISPASAEAQIARIARYRGATVEELKFLVGRYTEARTLGFLGEPRVNVLLLNLELDRKFPLKR
ncbi:MAG TPA: potassium-transporting ATPase subunit KdpC [Bryobacteraceae bacterium]|nr:potassium-transporting ATPase subunit KdpC [Bryobacteraceae bacterium]